MAFCKNCGKELAGDEKFCISCGTAVNETDVNQRKTKYEGEIHKCPNCGEVLESLVINCPSCGYEIRGGSSSKAVQDFAMKLSQVTTEEQKITLLRSFPIPNTKEDIFEFMILATSNMIMTQQIQNDNLREKISEAWQVKFEQSYQKALLLFKSDSDFSEIQKIYDKGQKNIIITQKRVIKKKHFETLARNIAVCVGIITIIIAVIIDKAEGNSSMVQLIGYIVLIASACTLTKRGASMIDFGISALSGVITICLSFLLDNSSMGEICGGIILIIIAITFFKSVGNYKNKN